MNKELIEKVAKILVSRSHDWLNEDNTADMAISADESEEIISLCADEAIDAVRHTNYYNKEFGTALLLNRDVIAEIERVMK